MEVTELPTAEIKELQDKTQPVLEKHSVTVGADTVTAVQTEAELAKIRK